MRVIDFHTHAFPDAVAASAIPALEAEADVTAVFDGTVGGLLAEMDRCGVDVSVIQPVATKPTQVRAINDWAAGLASDRIVPFGAMHPDVDDPDVEIERMAAHGLRGFKMHPEYQDFEPHEARMEPVYEAAISYGMVVLFHAGIDIGLPTLRGTPRSFAAMLDAWPRMKVVLAHMGGFRLWQEVADLIAGRDVYLDTCYTLGHLPDDCFLSLVREHGAHRIVFGSDGPWTAVDAELAHLRRLGLSDDELADILNGSATRLLGDV
ncbi:MAG: amidohydrolase [Actinobacteria bacterium]|nr:MAG: amidohydrolase [Actinomycetota bacterium]